MRLIKALTGWQSAAIILTVSALFVFGPFKQVTYNLLGSSIKDAAIFGWPEDKPEDYQAFMPTLETVNIFATQAELENYLTEKYGPDQKVHFNCLNEYGQGGPYTKIKVSKISGYDCDYGYAVIYKFQLP